jgi:recombination protein RecT
MKGSPGELVAAYAIIRFKDGGSQVEVMTREQILDVRDRPKPGKKMVRRAKEDIDGPWNTDESEMWRKTVVRRACKYAPLSPELRKQLETEDEIDDALTIDVVAEAAKSEGAKELSDAPATKKLAAKLGKGKDKPAEEQPAEPEHDPETGELPMSEAEKQAAENAEREPGVD